LSYITKIFSQWENDILADQERAICFSGHRPSKLPDGNASLLISDLERAIIFKIQQGKRTFINGCMAGFDILAGESVLKLRQIYPPILCVTVAPFRIGYFKSKNWTADWKKRALEVYNASDMAFSLTEEYRPGIYYARNDFMLAHASGVVCYYTGRITGTKGKGDKGGGTQYTVNRAFDIDLDIHNLHK